MGPVGAWKTRARAGRWASRRRPDRRRRKKRFLVLCDDRHGMARCFVRARSRAELEALLAGLPGWQVVEDDLDDHACVRLMGDAITRRDLDPPNDVLRAAMAWKPVEDEPAAPAATRR